MEEIERVRLLRGIAGQSHALKHEQLEICSPVDQRSH